MPTQMSFAHDGQQPWPTLGGSAHSASSRASPDTGSTSEPTVAGQLLNSEFSAYALTTSCESISTRRIPQPAFAVADGLASDRTWTVDRFLPRSTGLDAYRWRPESVEHLTMQFYLGAAVRSRNGYPQPKAEGAVMRTALSTKLIKRKNAQWATGALPPVGGSMVRALSPNASGNPSNNSSTTGHIECDRPLHKTRSQYDGPVAMVAQRLDLAGVHARFVRPPTPRRSAIAR